MVVAKSRMIFNLPQQSGRRRIGSTDVHEGQTRHLVELVSVGIPLNERLDKTRSDFHDRMIGFSISHKIYATVTEEGFTEPGYSALLNGHHRLLILFDRPGDVVQKPGRGLLLTSWILHFGRLGPGHRLLGNGISKKFFYSRKTRD